MSEKKLIRVAAAAILREGKFLAAKRGAGKIAETAHRFEFPGGKLEPSERPEQALRREIREELSVEVEVLRRLALVRHEYAEAVVELDVYLCRLKGGEPRSSEHEELRWIIPAELGTLDWAPADEPVLELIAREFG